MKKSKLATVFLIISLIFLISACGSASGGEVEPTARPYTPDDSLGTGGESGPVVGNAEDGATVFNEYCSECHDIGEGVNIEGPSLFAAGTRLDYDYVKSPSCTRPNISLILKVNLKWMIRVCRPISKSGCLPSNWRM